MSTTNDLIEMLENTDIHPLLKPIRELQSGNVTDDRLMWFIYGLYLAGRILDLDRVHEQLPALAEQVIKEYPEWENHISPLSKVRYQIRTLIERG